MNFGFLQTLKRRRVPTRLAIAAMGGALLGLGSAACQSHHEGSQVSVTVGTLGDPAVGAELAKKIKDKAEGH